MFPRPTLRSNAVVAFALAASFVGTASVAVAQDSPYTVYGQRPGTKLQIVSYRDLNLIYPAHQAVLNQRVGQAVRRVCSFDNGNIPIMDNDYRVCRNGAWGSARPQISNAIGRAHYLARTGRSPRAAGYIMLDRR
ncbi:MAG TPA: UrcA family protein [Sphingomicrobium sp.]|nr:UrcA family protein [Sphingomicrobium sp.]